MWNLFLRLAFKLYFVELIFAIELYFEDQKKFYNNLFGNDLLQSQRFYS